MKLRIGIFLGFLLAYANLSAQQPDLISRDLPEGVEVAKDISYAKNQGRKLLLDLYKPSGQQSAALPTVIVIRGGGFRSGDKDGFAPIAAALARRGLAAVCIEYRNSSEANFPAAVLDTKLAVKWVKENAVDYGLNPDAIGAIGGSAGAHLAMTLGVSAHVENLNPKKIADYSIQAVVALAPITDFSKMIESPALIEWLGVAFEDSRSRWELASPTSHVNENAAPMLFIHSLEDRVVPFEQSISAIQIMGAKGIHTESIFIPNAPHAFWNFTTWFDYSMDKAAVFFAEQFNK